MVCIRIPAPLRPHAGQQPEFTTEAQTVSDALGDLVGRFPQLRRQLFAENGRRRGYVNLFVNERGVPDGGEAHTSLRDGDVITIVPSIAGG